MRKNERRGAHRAACVAAALSACLLLSGCAAASADDDGAEQRDFEQVADTPGDSGEMAEGSAPAAPAEQPAAEADREAQPEPAPADAAGGYDEELNNNPAYLDHGRFVQGDREGLNSFDGTYEFNGREETYYANRAVYDDQLWVDEEGFFRTDDGKYVVASSDYKKGAVIEISRGEAVVMDDGGDPGNVDVPVTWGRDGE